MAADGEIVGEIADAWVDQTESVIRYYEIKFGREKRLIPQHFALLRKQLRGRGKEFYVHALMSDQYSDIPKTKKKDEITMLEEEKIMGYFGGGLLYAHPQRQEPKL